MQITQTGWISKLYHCLIPPPQTKKGRHAHTPPVYLFGEKNKKNYYRRASSLTVSFFLPFALLLLRTFRPLTVAIFSRNPCLFLLFLCDGWNVLLVISFYVFSDCKSKAIFLITKMFLIFFLCIWSLRYPLIMCNLDEKGD